MQKNEWIYQRKAEIRNFKDLEMEQMRLQLHQKFLGQLLKQDKINFKQAIKPQHLINSALTGLFNNPESKSGISSNSAISGLISSLVSWILKKIF